MRSFPLCQSSQEKSTEVSVSLIVPDGTARVVDAEESAFAVNKGWHFWVLLEPCECNHKGDAP